MNESRRYVLRLLSAGRITAAEAERLIATLGSGPSWSLLLIVLGVVLLAARSDLPFAFDSLGQLVSGLLVAQSAALHHSVCILIRFV
jgi:hypothetical protein